LDGGLTEERKKREKMVTNRVLRSLREAKMNASERDGLRMNERRRRRENEDFLKKIMRCE